MLTLLSPDETTVLSHRKEQQLRHAACGSNVLERCKYVLAWFNLPTWEVQWHSIPVDRNPADHT